MALDENTFSSFYLYQQHKELYFSRPKVAFLQYKNSRIDLLSGKKNNTNVYEFLEELEDFKVGREVDHPHVIHLMYEFGFVCNQLDDLLDDNKPLALYIEYSKALVRPIFKLKESQKLEVENVSFTSFEDYHRKFEKVYHHLIDGDCYQVNLTTPFFFQVKANKTAEEILGSMWQDPLKIGAYAHATYSHALDKFFLSNSPECLFQIKKQNEKYKILSLPIKGTCKVENDSERSKKWEELLRSKKDQAELFMITDLMRNDLSRVEQNPSRILHKKYPLHVPGLIHQFSVIESEVNENTSLRQILESLYPGGSITGAPKKRVMEIIKQVEKYQRSFYCGSTILWYKNIKTASINIRSAEINFSAKEVTYGSGGGVTLKSQPGQEYDEMLDKLKSFLAILGPK